MPRAATVVSLPPALARSLRAGELSDLFAYVEPDAVLVGRAVASGRLCPPESDVPAIAADGERHRIAGIDVATARTAADLAEVADDDSETTYVLSDLLDLRVDAGSLATALDGGERYRDALGEGASVQLAAGLPADYRREWDGLDVQGVAPIETRGARAIPVLTLGPDGVVAVDPVGTDSLGLRAVDGVGERRAGALREAGYGRADLVDAAIRELADLSGFGRETARAAVRSARAVERGEPVRTGDAPLPSDPLFVDIETDGLRPSVVWQVGLLRGGEYESFLARDPDEAPAMLGRLLDRLAALDGTLVAWNGRGFDFPILEEQIVGALPDRRGEWRRRSQFDPLRWARDEGNALLPGRTNRLGDVADALGYEGDDAGLTGAETARRYRRWMEGGPEPNWERHETYCENDVRMLAAVYRAIDDAGRIESERETTARDTRQGSLSEFG